MTVYVAVRDGYNHSYGSLMYLTGVFDTKDEAQKHGRVIEAELNTPYPLVPIYEPWDKRGWDEEDLDEEDKLEIANDDSPVNYGNDKFIGGYVE